MRYLQELILYNTDRHGLLRDWCHLLLTVKLVKPRKTSVVPVRLTLKNQKVKSL